ncbi:MAG: hypothetical protein ABIZ91_03760 [Gemmatimonadaceae bacterium]
MKTYIATASPDDVRWAVACGLADGILISGSMLDADIPGDDLRDRALDLSRLIDGMAIVSVGARDAGVLYHEGRELARLSDQLIIEMPLDADTLESLHRAVIDGCRVAASMVFTSSQALLAAKAGAMAVLVPVAALEALGLNLASTLSEMRAIYNAHLIECEIVAVCPQSASQFGVCAVAGADAVVVDVSTVRDLLLHPLTDRTLDAMLPGLTARSRQGQFT